MQRSLTECWSSETKYLHNRVPDRILLSEPVIHLYDDVLDVAQLAEVQTFLEKGNWKFGAESVAFKVPGSYRYWYTDFAKCKEPSYTQDCSSELNATPIIARMWDQLKSSIFAGHVLVRCYANGYPYGCEGLVHNDSSDPNHYTALFYANLTWHPNWSGETVFLTSQMPAEVVAAVLPRPNRLLVFRGDIPHVARAISRLCPLLRITLMFKTYISGI